MASKPFSTFSMTRLRTLQFRLNLTPLFTAMHAFLISPSPFVFMICDLGSPSFLCRSTAEESRTIIRVFFFILVTLDLCLLLIHLDLCNFQKWPILISVNRDLDSFLFSEIRDQKQTPLFFLEFSSMEKVFKIYLNLQTFFLQFSSVFLGGIRLSWLPLNCHYHRISLNRLCLSHYI